MILDDLKRADRPGWQVNERRLKAAMGIVGKWPDEGVPLAKIANTFVYVLDKNPKGVRHHRARAICAYCGDHVSAGRLHQHLKVHKEQLLVLTPDEELDLIEYNNSLRPD